MEGIESNEEVCMMSVQASKYATYLVHLTGLLIPPKCSLRSVL